MLAHSCRSFHPSIQAIGVDPAPLRFRALFLRIDSLRRLLR
jgi:hypothetical protein